MGIYIKADGNCKLMPGENKGKLSLEQLQKAVGGYIEQVPAAGGFMIVNEEGRLQNLPYNEAASYFADQPIVGDAVFCLKKEME